MKSILFYLVIIIAFLQFAQAQPVPQDTSDIVWQINSRRDIYKIFFSKDSKQLIVCENDMDDYNRTVRYVVIRDVVDGSLIQELPGESEASLSRDGTLLVTHSSDSILIREYPSLTLKQKIISDGLDGKFALSPDNKYFASAADFHGIRIFDIDSGKVIDSIKNFPFIFHPKYGGGHYVYLIGYNLDGTKLLFSGDWAFLYDLALDTVIHQFPLSETPQFSPDFNKIAIMQRDSAAVYFYNAITYEGEKSIKLGGSEWFDFVYSPDGNNIVTASNNGELNIWEIDSSKILYKFYIDNFFKPVLRHPAYSNDGKYIAFDSGILFLLSPTVKSVIDDTNKVDTNKIDFNKIYPNPSTGLVKVVFNLINSESININISDNAGRIYNSVYLGYLEKGNNIYEFNASAFSIGIYYITIQGNSFLQTYKLVKE